MKQYKLVNNLLGWITFAIAAFTYCSTVEPTASFWDCPEFITTAYKLEVGHPPGAPFFMLTGNFFSQFTDDPTRVAYMVNIMSALLSAFCILFLFWSITHLARKLLCQDGKVTSWAQTLLIMGCGLTGALAYTWSDTFWFSAVEGEVYAYSSMFTALVFWLILKWEEHADEPHADRWIVLIFYLTGLSIGVHLLNLLCLPAIALVYYYKKNPGANLKGSLLALGISVLLVAAVLYGLVPGIVKVGGWFELFFVNTLGLGFNSGLIVYLLLLIGIVLAAIWSTTRSDRRLITLLYTLSVAMLGIPFYGSGVSSVLVGIVLIAALVWLLRRKTAGGQYLMRKRFLNTSLLCMLMLMIGYSSYSVIVLRSTQNTPMDQNSPEDIFTLGRYLSREQYGDRPLFYGEAYTSQYVDYDKGTQVQRHEKLNASEPDRYDEVDIRKGLIVPDQLKMLFPRMHSQSHTAAYEDWLGGVDKHSVTFTFKDETGVEQGPYMGEMPSQWDNIRFFLSYQINFLYWRYFMWNFAGRQNDIQGNGEPEHGNWITGIPFIDNALYGDQSKLPDELRENKGHNVFYCLPLLLGLLGLFWQAYRGEQGIRQFWVVFFLFFMTGLAIVFYLNQTPMQARERDYAYAGSFYAFAIWIGLGVAALAQGLQRVLKKPLPAAAVASLVGILVPLQMVSQTWDDHDRSDRYACRDFGANYLNTLPVGGHPVIFTNGDNDTFPLWYNQEIEGVRTDARVCNLSYLQTDWYTDQMRRPAYDSPALPIHWNRYEYVDNVGHDVFYVRPDLRAELDQIRKDRPEVNPYELAYLIDHYVRPKGYMPTDSFVVKVNKEAVLRSGMLLPEGPDSIPEYMTVSLKGKRIIPKNDMMVYEMLARNDWKRPLYMSVTLGSDNYAGLQDYLVLEGLAYRITPFHMGMAIDADKMYDNMMNRFRYGNVKAPGIYLDETVMRMCQTHRHMFMMLAKQFLTKGDTARALKVLRKCKAELPAVNIPYDTSGADHELVQLWMAVGQKKEAARVAEALGTSAYKYLTWVNTLGDRASRFVRNCERQATMLSMMTQALKDCSSPLAKTFDRRFRELEQTPAIQLVLQSIQDREAARYRQMMQEQQEQEGGGVQDFGDYVGF